MQMRAGYVTGSAAFCDDLTFINSVSDGNADLTEMSVIGKISVVVLYLYKITVAPVIACVDDLSAVGGINGRSA